MAVVALGKAGGREMMAGSDLDLMLIYDHPDGRHRKSRRAAPAGEPMVRARRACLCRGRDRARGGRPAVSRSTCGCGRQATRARSRCRSASFQRYHAEIGMDLGAHGADPRPCCRRSAGTAHPHRDSDRRGIGACRRCRPHPCGCCVDARAHAARPAAGWAVGREAARRAARSRWSSSLRCCSSFTRARRRSCVRRPRVSRWRGLPRQDGCRRTMRRC